MISHRPADRSHPAVQGRTSVIGGWRVGAARRGGRGGRRPGAPPRAPRRPGIGIVQSDAPGKLPGARASPRPCTGPARQRPAVRAPGPGAIQVAVLGAAGADPSRRFRRPLLRHLRAARARLHPGRRRPPRASSSTRRCATCRCSRPPRSPPPATKNPHTFARTLAVNHPIGLRLYRRDGTPLGGAEPVARSRRAGARAPVPRRRERAQRDLDRDRRPIPPVGARPRPLERRGLVRTLSRGGLDARRRRDAPRLHRAAAARSAR